MCDKKSRGRYAKTRQQLSDANKGPDPFSSPLQSWVSCLRHNAAAASPSIVSTSTAEGGHGQKGKRKTSWVHPSFSGTPKLSQKLLLSLLWWDIGHIVTFRSIADPKSGDSVTQQGPAILLAMKPILWHELLKKRALSQDGGTRKEGARHSNLHLWSRVQDDF